MLAANTALKELDLSSNNWGDSWNRKGDGPGFAQELSVGIKDNGALSSANLLKNDIGIDQARALVSILKEHPTLKSLCGNKGGETQLDMSGKMEGAADAIMLAPEIIDNGALSVTNFMGNQIGKEQLAKLQEIMRSKPNLVSLCGIADDATEADLSGLGMDADDAAILASELPDKGALSKFIFGGDRYRKDGQWVYPEPATFEVGMAEADFSNKNLGTGGAIIISAWLMHKDKGAMTSLNLASNQLRAEGARVVAEAIKVTKCTPAIILVPFSCPSEFSFNCCLLFAVVRRI
jgi:hypothetical protein